MGAPASLLGRLIARTRAHELDRALLAGADPSGSRGLAERARTLSSPRFRRSIADGLEHWLAAADGARNRRRVLPSRALAAEHAVQVREIAALLRGPTPLYARGVAWVSELFTDGTGPAYGPDGELLAAQLQGARAALAGESLPDAVTRRPGAGRRSREVAK